MVNPADDVKDQLNTKNVATSGTNLFVGPVRPVSQYVPANCIFVLAYGGAPGERFLSGGAKTENRYPSVQVTVRWNDFSTGYAKARAVYDALDAETISGYWNVKGLHSEPLFIGQDENGNYRWTVNFEMSYLYSDGGEEENGSGEGEG